MSYQLQPGYPGLSYLLRLSITFPRSSCRAPLDHSERLDEAGHHFHLRSPSFVGEHTLFPPAERASGALSDTGGSTRETGGPLSWDVVGRPDIP
ncbi:unnamed protein product [Enterobius vermicularis]|uniref:Uncharacterized protein n=1 Tax=Enterobius vermicularis TaxID=51028 RepID=A0A0N4VKR6_ENTVE|nr:unnamed protein product [Enterobius vermicularis]